MRLSSRNRRKEIRAITIMRMHSTYEIFETKSKLATGSILIRPNIEIKLKRHWITLNSFLLGTFSFNCLTFIFIFFRLPLPFHLNYIIYNLFRKVRSLIFFPPGWKESESLDECLENERKLKKAELYSRTSVE